MLPVRIAILSHLSDAQELMSVDVNRAYDEITFAKRLTIEYFDLEKAVSEEELDALWNKMFSSNSNEL